MREAVIALSGCICSVFLAVPVDVVVMAAMVRVQPRRFLQVVTMPDCLSKSCTPHDVSGSPSGSSSLPRRRRRRLSMRGKARNRLADMATVAALATICYNEGR